MSSSSSSERILRHRGTKWRRLILQDDSPEKNEMAPPSRSYAALQQEAITVLPDSPRFWNSISVVFQDKLKITILKVLKQDNPKEICKRMWKMASQIFTFIIINKREWPDMISFFCESLNSRTLYVQDYAMMFFLELPTCLRDDLSKDVQNLRLNFSNKFNSSNGERKVYALAALVNLIRHMSSEYYSLFRDLLMPMVKAVSHFLDNDVTEENARTSLVKLAELSGEEPRFFDSHLNQVFHAMVKIALNDKLEEQTTYLTVKMMYAFDDIAIKRVNKRILGSLCHVLIRMISLIPDKSGNYLLGEIFLQRISMLRCETLRLSLLLEIIPDDMASSDWRKRYAAVTIIGVMAKGCTKATSDNLGEVMKVVMKSTIDPSPNVLFAAIRTVKTMSLELPPHTLDQHANFLITWLHLALADGNRPFKQAAAVSALRSLCESCSSCIIEPRMETSVSKLLELLQVIVRHFTRIPRKQPLYLYEVVVRCTFYPPQTPLVGFHWSKRAEVQAESLNTLALFARLSKDTFCNCYDLVITSLKKHLAGATSKWLQRNSFQCILTVAMVVGKDKFKKDATEVVALLLSTRWYLGEDNHSLKIDLLQAWEQLLICLGSHFYPYVKDLMPELLRSARLGSNSATECVVLIEKRKACKLLLYLTKEFKEKLFPWIDQVSDLLLSLVKFHDGDIRKIAFSAMPKLLLSAKFSAEEKQAHGFTNSYLHKLVLRIVPSLLEALDEDTDGEICAKIVKSLTKCVEIAGGFLSKNKIQQIANAMEKVLKAISRKHFSEEDDVTDVEKKIIGEVVDFIRVLMEIYDKISFTFVDKIMACIRSMRRDVAKEKETAIVTLCEVFVKCKRAANRY